MGLLGVVTLVVLTQGLHLPGLDIVHPTGLAVSRGLSIDGHGALRAGAFREVLTESTRTRWSARAEQLVSTGIARHADGAHLPLGQRDGMLEETYTRTDTSRGSSGCLWSVVALEASPFHTSSPTGIGRGGFWVVWQ